MIKKSLEINESLVPQHLLPRRGNLRKKLRRNISIKISKMLRAEIFMMLNRHDGFEKCNRNVYLGEQNDSLNHCYKEGIFKVNNLRNLTIFLVLLKKIIKTIYSKASIRIPYLKQILLSQARNSTLFHGVMSCKLYQSGITMFYNS